MGWFNSDDEDDKADDSDGAVPAAAKTIKRTVRKKQSRLDEIMASMPTRDRKGSD